MNIRGDFLGLVQTRQRIAQSNDLVAIGAGDHGTQGVQGRRCQKGRPHSIQADIGVVIGMNDTDDVIEFDGPAELGDFFIFVESLLLFFGQFCSSNGSGGGTCCCCCCCFIVVVERTRSTRLILLVW
jgi:hypothetical protein